MREKSVTTRNHQARTEFWRLLQWFSHRYGFNRERQTKEWEVSANALTRWSQGRASPATMLRVAVRVLQVVKDELQLLESRDLRPNRSLSSITRMVERSVLWASERQTIRAYALMLMQDKLVQKIGREKVVSPKLECSGLDYGSASLTMGTSRLGGPPYDLAVTVDVRPGHGLVYLLRIRGKGQETGFDRRGRLTDRSWTQACVEAATYCK